MMPLCFRNAVIDDLPILIALLADDSLGSRREQLQSPLSEKYIRAFSAIASDPHNELVVVSRGDEIVGFLQLTFIPYLTHQGSWRALIEGVRVKKTVRGQGIGSRMLQWAIARAKEQGCSLVQLTTNKQRADAIRFYQRLGFEASHEGMKLYLS